MTVASSVVASLKILLGVDASGAASGFKEAANEARKFERAVAPLSLVGRKLEQAGKVMSVAVTLPLAAAGYQATRLAMAAVESENLFTVSMGRMADKARAWSNETAKALKMNSYELRQMVGTFNVMLGSMGAGEQAAYDMSTALAKLAYDMASFYNLDVADAFQKLQSGISGEVEPLKRLGILVNENTVKEYAYAHGIARRGEELTNSQKVMARYGVIMEQTSKAQGDMARTLDSPANKLRAMKARLEEAAIAFGTLLLPVVSRLADGVKSLADWFNQLDPAAKKTVVTVAAVAAAMGPALLVTGALVRAAVSLATAKTVLATLLRGRVVPAVAASAAATAADTAATTANTVATNLNATAQRMLAASTLTGKAGFGDLAKVLGGLNRNIIVSEHAAKTFSGVLGGAGGAGGLAGSLSGVGGALTAIAGPLLIAGAAFLFIYAATKKWGDAAKPIPSVLSETERNSRTLTAAVDGTKAALSSAEGPARRYAEQLEVIGDSADYAATRLKRTKEAMESATAYEAEVANRAMGDRWAAWAAGMPTVLPGAKEIPTPPGEPNPDDVASGLSKVSAALSAISEELSIVDAEWGLWAARFRGAEGDPAWQAARVEHLADKMRALKDSIAAVSAMKGKDAEETRQLTLCLLELQTQLAEATKEYEKAKAAMSAPSPERSRYMLYVGEQAAKHGGWDEYVAWGISAYRRRMGEAASGLTDEEIKAILFPALPKAAEGAIVKARPGGTLVVAGEGGKDEAIVPLTKDGSFARSIVVNIYNTLGVVKPQDAQRVGEGLGMGLATYLRRKGVALAT